MKEGTTTTGTVILNNRKLVSVFTKLDHVEFISCAELQKRRMMDCAIDVVFLLSRPIPVVLPRNVSIVGVNPTGHHVAQHLEVIYVRS